VEQYLVSVEDVLEPVVAVKEREQELVKKMVLEPWQGVVKQEKGVPQLEKVRWREFDELVMELNLVQMQDWELEQGLKLYLCCHVGTFWEPCSNQ